MKAFLAGERDIFRDAPAETTLKVHRNAYLERAANLFNSDAASGQVCTTFDAHSLRLYHNAFQVEDMSVGIGSQLLSSLQNQKCYCLTRLSNCQYLS